MYIFVTSRYQVSSESSIPNLLKFVNFSLSGSKNVKVKGVWGTA